MPYSNDPVVKRCRNRFSWPNFKFGVKPVLPELEPIDVLFGFYRKRAISSGLMFSAEESPTQKKVEEYWNKKIS